MKSNQIKLKFLLFVNVTIKVEIEEGKINQNWTLDNLSQSVSSELGVNLDVREIA